MESPTAQQIGGLISDGLFPSVIKLGEPSVIKLGEKRFGGRGPVLNARQPQHSPGHAHHPPGQGVRGVKIHEEQVT